jgi:hypothetical protein
MTTSVAKWAEEQFGSTQLGDVRRTRRLVEMAARAAMRPSGKVSVVFDRSREREGAYDFLESRLADSAAIAASMFDATVARASGAKSAYVVLDISTVTLTDEADTKGFGHIGSPNRPTRGLMVMNALAVGRDGVPLGLVEQHYWARAAPSLGTVAQRTERNLQRPFEEKQGAHFVEAAEKTIERLRAEHVVPWFVVDREGDSRDILLALDAMACVFTIRGTKNRRLTTAEDEANVRESLLREPTLGRHQVEIPRNGSRAARTATVAVYAKEVELYLRATPLANETKLKLHAVLVRETAAGARRKDALDWLLYTNAPVRTEDAALHVIEAYRARWRIEEFHRTWKQGECNVESAQLRSAEAVVKWATILSAVAVRIERLKYLSRKTPDEPATIEFSALEIEALKIERRTRNKGRVRLPETPTIAEATEWIAEMGGWMGHRSSGPPGSITIARGLDRLSIYAQAVADVRADSARPGRKGAR